MKRIHLIILLCLFVMAVLIVPAFARYDREEGTPGYSNSKTVTSRGIAVNAPSEVYAVTVYPLKANEVVTLYDLNSSAHSQAKFIISAPTQYTTKREVIDPPLNFETLVFVEVSNGYATLEYR